MRWYMVVLLVCLIVSPFEALYLHIRAEKRRAATPVARRAAGDIEGYYCYATGVSAHVFRTGDEVLCDVIRAALPGGPAAVHADGIDWACPAGAQASGKMPLMDRATGAWAASVERRDDGALVLRAGDDVVEGIPSSEGIAYARDGVPVGFVRRRLDPQRVIERYGDRFPMRFEASCASGLPDAMRTLMLCAPFLADLSRDR